MLYLSTRNKTDSFTAYRATHNDTTPDGGLYVPLRLTAYTGDEIQAFRRMSFGEAVAKVLNTFISEQLTGWDVDFCIGRAPIKLETIGHKTSVAELWHNPEGSYEVTRNTLYSRIYSTSDTPSAWAMIAIDIAILFGVYSQMTECDEFDISISEEKKSMVIAAWYAKKLGLPIGQILLTCGEHSNGWDFIRDGIVRGGAFFGIAEYILFDTFGFETVAECIAAIGKKRTYKIDPELLPQITDHLRVSVVGKSRADDIVKSLRRINGYHIDRSAAAAFGGLQDFRSQVGEGKLTLLISEAKPD